MTGRADELEALARLRRIVVFAFGIYGDCITRDELARAIQVSTTDGAYPPPAVVDLAWEQLEGFRAFERPQ